MSVDHATQEVSLELLGNERLILGQVAEALKRIDAGTYGRCTLCGRDIAPERLQALPYTPYCVDCARRAEANDVPASGPV
jgi:RNA polymerase-binding transcription factor DksA